MTLYSEEKTFLEKKNMSIIFKENRSSTLVLLILFIYERFIKTGPLN